MTKFSVKISLLLILALLLSSNISAYASNFGKVLRANVLSANTSDPAKLSPNSNISDFENVDSKAKVEVKDVEKQSCEYEVPEIKTYKAEVIAIRKKLRVETGEIFKVKVFLKNEGNMPWKSDKSDCNAPLMFLGTDSPRDRASDLYYNWYADNRISMDQEFVKPGKIASFTFEMKAPNKSDVYKEYFTPMLDGITWLDSAKTEMKIIVGDINISSPELRKRLLFAMESGTVMDFDLNGEKKIAVDLSEQKMLITLDGKLIREFRVSTGKSSTPTPVGNYKIKLKQETRVGSEAPHYIMPKFQWFRDGGYGLHALPSLGSDGGVFWTEARSHIGIPVSHGCIRMLPEDADFAYEFTDIGTEVAVAK
ncbi:MAG: L,D-transpeptidase family protein [Candidatus Gracilibacteria bacterium]|jgi:lipoprotein-anchoring transpeptidase ErfK/SrfK